MPEFNKNSNIADRLAEAIKLTGKSIGTISYQTGLRQPMIRWYLSGEVEPRQATATKLATCLNVSELWLYGYDVPMNSAEGAQSGEDLAHERGSFAYGLRRTLIDANMTAAELSKLTGVSLSMISYYINGKAKPNAERLNILCQALGVSEAWLLGSEENPRRNIFSKMDDDVVQAIASLRNDPDFLEVISDLVNLPHAEYESFKRILSAIYNKNL